MLTLFPSCQIPVRAKVKIISVLDKYLLPLLDGVDAGKARDHPPPGMVKHNKLSVGDEAMVGLVGQRGRVVGQFSELSRNINCAIGLGARIKYLVSILIPSFALTRIWQNPNAIIESYYNVLFNFLPATSTLEIKNNLIEILTIQN